MMKEVLIIGMGDVGHGCVSALEIMKAIKINEKIEVVDLNKTNLNELKRKLENAFPEERQRGVNIIEIKNYEPMPACFFDKPKKPKYNPKTGKVKYF